MIPAPYTFQLDTERRPSTTRSTHCPSNTDYCFLKYNFSRYFDVIARRGFSLFTLIVKFNIRDNAHPLSRSWNSLSDARIGSMTCCSYYSRKSVYRYISLFFIFMLLLARLSFVANSPLNVVFTFTLPCLSKASRTRSRATFPTSSKNRRGSI